MKTLLCCIGRCENKYIREYVEYYKNIGITNICLFDNNRDGEEDFNDVIGDYIDDGFVILKDYRNRQECQYDAYNECYSTYGDEYDWIMFFDIDEFLSFTTDEYKNISDYLSEDFLKPFDMIHVNWLIYGDDNKLFYNKKPLLERILNPIDINKHISYDFPENNHIKSIIRGGLKSIEFYYQPHTIKNQIKCCNEIGEEDFYGNTFSKFSNKKIVLKHFTTKTIEEYCDKMKRGFPHQKWYGSLETIQFLLEERFFRTNEITKSKIDIIKRKLDVDMSYLLPKDIKNDKKNNFFNFCKI